jgi:hypothetical protein
MTNVNQNSLKLRKSSSGITIYKKPPKRSISKSIKLIDRILRNRFIFDAGDRRYDAIVGIPGIEKTGKSRVAAWEKTRGWMLKTRGWGQKNAGLEPWIAGLGRAKHAGNTGTPVFTGLEPRGWAVNK